ncbi:uncharacterized protein LOC118205744 [Stegodyphus dumicola]|uniref:uncharacterized protein LOC118205744 n=1 Tax=Stegodyphus dumicola TaxID=202533 RepID=UPI0015A89303|nr:uncharacterized protein LOC118205744 [Stegodyphus dumicola]
MAKRLSKPERIGPILGTNGEYIFIDLNLKVSKYAVRSWKTQSNGIGGDGQPLLVLYMRIKYYVDCHLLISEKVVRHHYYLQLRENVKNYCQAVSEEKSFLLAALALQADLGNYDEEKHKNRYFEISNYFPSWIIEKLGEDFIIRNIPALHKDNAGLSRGEAQVGYIKEASDVTAPHNLHFYKMRRKKGKLWSDVWLGIRDSGIHIYEQQEHEKTKSLLSTFLWCDIAKLHFEKKKFEILSEGSPEYRRFTYFVQTEELSKHLLWICRTTHHFHMANQNRVADLKKLELDGGKSYREAYIYTDKIDQAWEKKQNTMQKNKYKSNIENSIVNFNGNKENTTTEKDLKPIVMKMSGMPWNNTESLESGRGSGQSLQHHSMEVLPLTNGCKFSSDIKYKSQSISCFSDRSLAPYSMTAATNNSGQLWSPPSGSSVSTTPTSTLMSRSSCASNTDSTCSTLSLTSSSTIKAGNSRISQGSNDGKRWVKCDSFEELPLKNSPPEKIMHKVCISTFVDKHVRTASVYDAVTTQKINYPKPSLNITASSTSSSNIQPNVASVSSSTVAPANVKTSDVKRTPSLNVCINNYAGISQNISKEISSSHTKLVHSIAQKPPRHYTSNAQTHTSSHGRTATRIGVSSLSRDQRLPLTLFNDQRMMACGSEPNLYVTVGDRLPLTITDNPVTSIKSQWLQRNFNSRSEMSLNVIEHNVQNGTFDFQSPNIIKNDSCDSRNRQLSLPDVCSDILEGDGDFPCIPPPPAYRNGVEDCVPVLSSSCSGLFSQNAVKLSYSLQSEGGSTNSSNLPSSSVAFENHKELKNAHSTPPDVLDIQQLRQRSRDLDLPLISALCNDRSLLMLPKTVPTCSRQRHLGNKDPMRFSRATSLPNGDMTDNMLANTGRPISWHIDSSHVPHWSEVSKPCSASWDNAIKSRLPQINAALSENPAPSLPPTILTSFGKTPVKQVKSVHDHSSVSDNYRYNKNQMIPTKLLAGPFGCIPNGRLYQKGSSS